jgi:hypothetical protein
MLGLDCFRNGREAPPDRVPIKPPGERNRRHRLINGIDDEAAGARMSDPDDW